jgi:hypothetical protein
MNVKIDKADYTILYGVSEEQWPAWAAIEGTNYGGCKPILARPRST